MVDISQISHAITPFLVPGIFLLLLAQRESRGEKTGRRGGGAQGPG